MLPAIMAIISMAKAKADSQNQQNQQLAQNIANTPVATNQQPVQMQRVTSTPTINSVFGQDEEQKRRQMMGM
jgi:hypothetical protein